METKAIFACLLVALFIVGCAPTTSAPAPAPQMPAPSTPTETVDGSVPGANEEIREELIGKPSGDVDTGKEILANALSSDVRDLIERGRGREETGYAYLYTKFEGTRLAAEDINQATVYQRGTTRHATLYKERQIMTNYFIYGIVFDDAAQTAEAYCTDRRCDWSPGDDPVTKEVTYANYAFLTPSDWLDDMTQLEELGGETISGRTTMKLSGMIDGKDALIWLDRYSGLPMQVEHDGKTYQYTKIVLGVTDDELTP